MNLDDLMDEFSDALACLNNALDYWGIYLPEHYDEAHIKQMLKDLYEYAVLGKKPVHGYKTSPYIIGNGILQAFPSENIEKWREILLLAEARAELDEGENLTVEAIAKLANVDIKTVRNAISANELKTITDSPNKIVMINNNDARLWLKGRKNFKPTYQTLENGTELTLEVLEDISDLAQFCKTKNQLLDYNSSGIQSFLERFGQHQLSQFEMGIFDIPFEAMLPLAHIYQVDESLFLNKVLELVYTKEYDLLVKIISSRTKLIKYI